MKHRRLLAAFMSICMVASLVPVGAMTAFGDELRAAATGAYGDADGNGVVDLRDVLLVEQHFAGEDTPSLVLERADVNLDGVADLADADAIREYLVNVRPTLQPTSCTVSFDTNRTRPANTDTWDEQEELQGALYLEFGLYLTVKFKAQALAGAYSYEPTLCDKRFPLLTAGERYNVYDFARYPEDGEVLRIIDEDVDITNGIARTLPSSYLLMDRMDLTCGDKGKSVCDYGKFYYELSSELFSIDEATGLISVMPPEGKRYLECLLHVVWKSDKLAFSKYDIDITIPLVWTTMTSAELDERFGVSVAAGSVAAGYNTVWNQTVGRLDAFDLPTPADVLAALGYDRYTLASDASVNLRYADAGAYAQSVAQTAGITGIYADTTYLYDIAERSYRLTVEGVQLADGSTTSLDFYATYGDRFDLSSLRGTGQAGPATFTSFNSLARVGAGGAEVAYDASEAVAGLDFYEAFGGFEGTCTASYADRTRTLAFNFIGLAQDGGEVQASLTFEGGTAPVFDVDAFVSDYLQASDVRLPEGYVMHVEGVPDIGILDSSASFDIACQARPSTPVVLSFVTGSAAAPRWMPRRRSRARQT